MGLRDGRRRRWGSGEGGGSSAWEPDKGPEGSIPQARPRIRKIHNIPSFNLNHITEGCIQPLLPRRCAQMASLQLYYCCNSDGHTVICMPGWAGGRNEVPTTLHLFYLSHQPSSLSQNGPRTWLFSNLLLVTTYVGTSQQIVLLNQEEERSHGCPNHPPAAVPITATMGLRDGRRRHPERNSVAHGRKSIPIAQATLWRRLDECIFNQQEATYQTA